MVAVDASEVVTLLEHQEEGMFASAASTTTASATSNTSAHDAPASLMQRTPRRNPSLLPSASTARRSPRTPSKHARESVPTVLPTAVAFHNGPNLVPSQPQPHTEAESQPHLHSQHQTQHPSQLQLQPQLQLQLQLHSQPQAQFLQLPPRPLPSFGTASLQQLSPLAPGVSHRVAQTSGASPVYAANVFAHTATVPYLPLSPPKALSLREKFDQYAAGAGMAPPEGVPDHFWTQYINSPAASAVCLPTSCPEPRDILFNCLELVSEIVSYLPKTDLATTMRVSRAFHRATIPFLYKTLPWEQQNRRGVAFKKAFPKAFAIKGHRHCTCSQGMLMRFDMGTVILDATYADFSRDCHSCTHILRDTRCVFSPRMVARKGTSIDYHYCFPDHELLDVLPATEIVIYVYRLPTGFTYASRHPAYDSGPTPDAPPTKQVTIVVLPLMWHAISTNTYRTSFTNSWRTKESKGELLALLAEFGIDGASYDLTFVGLEDANPFANVKAHWLARDIRAASMYAEMMREADKVFWLGDEDGDESWTAQWTPRERALVKSRMRFVTLKEYLDSGAWRHELDAHLVGRWLNAYDARDKAMPATPVPDAVRREAAAMQQQIAAAINGNT